MRLVAQAGLACHFNLRISNFSPEAFVLRALRIVAQAGLACHFNLRISNLASQLEGEGPPEPWGLDTNLVFEERVHITYFMTGMNSVTTNAERIPRYRCAWTNQPANLEKMSEALVPPKPKLLLMQWLSSVLSRRSVTSGVPATPGSGSSTLILGAMNLWRIISRA